MFCLDKGSIRISLWLHLQCILNYFLEEKKWINLENFLCCANAVKVNYVQIVYSCFIFGYCK